MKGARLALPQKMSGAVKAEPSDKKSAPLAENSNGANAHTFSQHCLSLYLIVRAAVQVALWIGIWLYNDWTYS